MKVTNEENVDI